MDTKRLIFIFLTLMATIVVTQAATQAEAPQVRMRWQDFVSGPDGVKRLKSLQTAVQRMKSLDVSPKDSADYRRSWQYWANIHGYYGPQSPDGTVADHIQYLRQNDMGQYVPYYQGISDQTPPDATATTVWATCQHSGQTQALNFFGWHRMYLYYYERVLRWAANDDTLRLPYWDYTDPQQLTLPAAFRDTASTLYDAKRNPGINAGTVTLNQRSTNVDRLLQNPMYFIYQSRIEEGIHGYVHCTVGPTCPVAHMGDVPVAGNDPVFYSHHGNIDRLWACWQQLHGTPAGAWQDQMFSFVDETGTMRTQPVKNFLNSTTLGYVYDNVANCARSAPGAMVAAAAPREERKTAMLNPDKSLAITSATTSLDLEVPRPQLTTALSALQTPEAVTLVLRDITADSPPGVLFDVFLAKKDDLVNRQYVGTISWFGAFRHRHGGQGGPPKKTLSFDVTDALRTLGEGTAAAGLTVVIEATHGYTPTDETQLQAQRESAAKAFRPDAKMRIDAVELRAAAAAGASQ